MTDTIESLRAQLAEYEDAFINAYAVDERAREAWRTANPGNDLIWPDDVAMLTWLMDEVARLQAALANERKRCIEAAEKAAKHGPVWSEDGPHYVYDSAKAAIDAIRALPPAP